MTHCVCSFCGLEIRSRASKKRTGKENLFKALVKHQNKNHRAALNRRISAGIKRSQAVIKDFDAMGFRERLTNEPDRLLELLLNDRPSNIRKVVNIVDKFVAPFLPANEKLAWKLIKVAIKARERRIKPGTKVITPTF